jgi:hypothetical protein
MNLLEIIEIRDKLRSELAVVDKFLEIARARGFNGLKATNGKRDLYAIDAPQPGAQRDLPGVREYGGIAEAVREAIRMAPETYTGGKLFTILEKLNKPLSKLQIATVLNRFTDKGEIKVHKKGKGNRATIYKKHSAEPQSTEVKA